MTVVTEFTFKGKKRNFCRPSDICIDTIREEFLGPCRRAVELFKPHTEEGTRYLWACLNADPLPDFHKFQPAADFQTALSIA